MGGGLARFFFLYVLLSLGRFVCCGRGLKYQTSAVGPLWHAYIYGLGTKQGMLPHTILQATSSCTSELPPLHQKQHSRTYSLSALETSKASPNPREDLESRSLNLGP